MTTTETAATSARCLAAVDRAFEFSLAGATTPDLAPEIYRQRLVIEGIPATSIDDFAIAQYLRGLSDVCGMVTLTDPVTHRSDRFGWAGWIHWETSGAHFYAWDEPRLFFSVDVYTCRAFDPVTVVAYTERYFDAEQIVAKEF